MAFILAEAAIEHGRLRVVRPRIELEDAYNEASTCHGGLQRPSGEQLTANTPTVKSKQIEGNFLKFKAIFSVKLKLSSICDANQVILYDNILLEKYMSLVYDFV